MQTVAQQERRAQKRLETRVPILLEWTPHRGLIRRIRGFTSDISIFGVYCYIDEPIPEGRSVEFDLLFPAEMVATTPLALHCRGTALRTRKEGRLFGLAASIEARETRDLSEQGLEPERRLRRRITPECRPSVEYPGLRAEIRDLSETGAFIADKRPLPVGHQMDLRFQIDESGPPIQVCAVVRRVEPQVGMAVEFTALNTEAAHALHRRLAEKNLHVA